MKTPDLLFKKIVQKEVTKLSKQHQTTIKLSIKENRLDEYLEKFFALHKERWSFSQYSGIFEKHNLKRFYQKVSRMFANNDWLRLSALQVDSKIEAMEYGVAYSNKYYSLQCGCSQAGLKMKAGNVLTYRIFESLIGKTKIFHFLRGDEPYKFNWGCLNKLTINIELYRGFKSWLILLFSGLLKYVKLSLKALLSGKIM